MLKGEQSPTNYWRLQWSGPAAPLTLPTQPSTCWASQHCLPALQSLRGRVPVPRCTLMGLFIRWRGVVECTLC